MAEAFQVTAQAHPDRVALRTKGDEFSITWARVRRQGARDRGGPRRASGSSAGGTMAIMLTNRPEFHWFDAAALHLGATPFSLYNTYTRRADPVPGDGRRGADRRDREGLRGASRGS